jgi:TM2 domain-containing membrane protein YozV
MAQPCRGFLSSGIVREEKSMAIYTVTLDGVAYEADTIETLAQWTTEGRLTPDTVITDTGTGIKFTVSEHPQLRTRLPQAATSPPPTPPSASSPFSSAVGQTQRQQTPTYSAASAAAANKLPAGICGILLNCLGVHKFILGYNTEGLIMLLGSILTCGILSPVFAVIGLVEGIIYLTKSDEDFVETYVKNKKGWF